MFRFSLIILSIFNINNVICEVRPSNLPCKIEDIECTTRMTQWLYDEAVAGNAEKNIEKLDPMHLDVIEGIQGYVNYTLKDNTIKGYQKCKILISSLKPDLSHMHINILCPRFHMTGAYDIKGSLINYPIEGKGPFFITATNYNVTIDADAGVHKEGNNLRFKLKTFTAVAELMGSVDFELTNLFNGNKELSDPIHKFGKENPKMFASFLDKPIYKVAFKKIMKNINSCLKDIPVKELMQVDEDMLKF